MTPSTQPRGRRRYFRVSFHMPPDATVADAEAYILDAVGTMRGCYRPPGANDDDDPGHPMWPLEYDDVKVADMGYAGGVR